MGKIIRQSIVMLVAADARVTGVVYPLLVTGVAQSLFPARGERQRDRARRQAARLRADRPAVLRSEIFLEPTFGDGAVRRQQRRVERLQSRADQSARSPTRSSSASKRCARPIPATRRRYRSISSPLGQRPRSAHLARGGRISGRPRRACARRAPSATCESSSQTRPKAARSACSASRASTCSSSISRSTASSRIPRRRP